MTPPLSSQYMIGFRYQDNLNILKNNNFCSLALFFQKRFLILQVKGFIPWSLEKIADKQRLPHSNKSPLALTCRIPVHSCHICLLFLISFVPLFTYNWNTQNSIYTRQFDCNDKRCQIFISDKDLLICKLYDDWLIYFQSNSKSSNNIFVLVPLKKE